MLGGMAVGLVIVCQSQGAGAKLIAVDAFRLRGSSFFRDLFSHAMNI